MKAGTGHLVSYLLYRTMMFFFTIVPFGIMQRLSLLIAWLLRIGIRYRRKVVNDNLTRSFPHLSATEKKSIVKATYRNLAAVLLETMKMPSMNKQQINKRFKLRPNAEFEKLCREGRSVIIVSAHFGNWEWGTLAASGMVSPLKAVGFYKPITNKLIDSHERELRGRFGLEVVSMFETTKTFNLSRKTPTAFFLIADQSPSNRKTAIWLPFLNQPTPWLHGPEKHSRHYNYPVFLFIPIRMRPGYYEVEIQLLAEAPATLPPTELTRRYAAALEGYIKANPGHWLWTHRRWKMKP